MDWIEGNPLGEVLNGNIPQPERNKLGQALWDFYHFQMHTLKAMHADPHPGNFIITSDYRLGIIDFGCVKVIPENFYKAYFQLLEKDVLTLRQNISSHIRALRPASGQLHRITLNPRTQPAKARPLRPFTLGIFPSIIPV